MSTRRRLDAELVRRGLARSREHAAELVSAGRVAVAGPGRWQDRHAGQPGRADHGPSRPATDPGYASRGGRKLARRAGRLRGAAGGRPALPGRGRVHRRLHRRAAARRGGRRWWRSTSGYGQLAWALRSDDRVTVLDRVNVRQPAARAGGPAARAGHRRPVVHLAEPGAARAGRLRGPGRRLRAAGEAAVRGGQGPWSARAGWSVTRRCGPRAVAAVASGRGRARAGRGRGDRQPAARRRPATWSTSSGCAAARPAGPRPSCDQAIAEGPQ